MCIKNTCVYLNMCIKMCRLETKFGHLEIITNSNQIPTAAEYVVKTVITLLLLLCLNKSLH